jgi:hypothetical protein
MYLDDGLGSHPDEDVCTAMAAQVKQDFILSGFVPKNEKSTWQPICQIIFLGYVIDTDLEILSIPEKRLSKLSATIDDIGLLITQNYRIHVKKIASLVGQIISMSYVIGNVAHIMTKYLSIDILSADTWNSLLLCPMIVLNRFLFGKTI